MKDLIDRVIAFNRPAHEYDVQEAMQMLEKRFGEDLPIKLLESIVKVSKDQLKEILTKDLLEWMQENDQVTFETEDVKVKIRTNLSAKVLDAELAFKWLASNQYGDMIKDNLEFPKGELTNEAESALVDMGLSFIKKSGVHPQTLKKIMSDRLNDGEMLPDWSEDDPGDGIKIGYFDECVVKEK